MLVTAIKDTVEFGPFSAIKINTSMIPEAERSRKRFIKKIGFGTVTESAISDSLNSEAKLANIILGNVAAVSEEEQKEADKYRNMILETMVYGDEAKLPEILKSIVGTINEYNELKASELEEEKTNDKVAQLPMIISSAEAEIVIEKVSLADVTANISAAIHEFGIEADTDKQFATCFIMAYYKHSNRINKDVLDTVLKTDDDKSLYINILRWFDSAEIGNAKKAGNVLLEDSVVKELKEMLEWELSYDKDHVSAAQAININNGFKDILKSLEELKENIGVTPIVTVPEGKVIPKSGFTDAEKKDILKRLKEDFGEILEDYNVEGLLTYKFNILSEIAELVVMDKELKNAPSRYRIDPGIIIGNGVNLIYYAADQDGVLRDIYVNVRKRVQIVRNIIDNPGYTLTLEEVQQCLADSFTVKQIYYYIDMGSFSKHLSGLKEANMEKLENKLTAVYNVLNTPNGIPAARMRLKEWKGVDNFTLVSDKDCRSPFAMAGATCSDILPGMLISVVKNDITVTYKDSTVVGEEVREAKFVITK